MLKTLRVSPGDASLLAALRARGAALYAPCGGDGRCGRCLVTVTGPVSPLDGPERGKVRRAQGETLLACRFRAGGDCAVTFTAEEDMRVVKDGVDIPPGGVGLGAAVDIGTTTVALLLYDLQTGKYLGARSGPNAQRAFGADVISRIARCAAASGLEEQRDAIREQLSSLLDAACAGAGRDRSELTRLCVTGNTVMEHLLMGLNPTGIGAAPFAPLSLFGDSRPARELFSGFSPGAELYLCPAVAGYAGGDVTAGLLGSDALFSAEPVLYLDIGTNGEMALGDQDGFLVCAAAAGPAFEGGAIECGMAATAGAIDRVTLSGGALICRVVGGGPARGICGSGLVDAAAALLERGDVDPSGRMLCRDKRGERRCYLADGVYISGSDIRQLQLAKAAVRAGLETLLSARNLNVEALRGVWIAGGFGAYLDAGSAVRIGLLPPSAAGKTLHVGSAAGRGAAMALVLEQRRVLESLAKKCAYLELSASAAFMERYVACMGF